MRRLREVGMGAGYSWSHVFVPLIWLSLPGHRDRELRNALEVIGLPWTVGCALAELWVRHGVRAAQQVLGWLHYRIDELEMARPTTDRLGRAIEGSAAEDFRRFAPYSYLPDYVQEFVLGEAPLGTALQAGLYVLAQ
eukprot:1858807-Alexandrium_andersonii.AAC.1